MKKIYLSIIAAIVFSFGMHAQHRSAVFSSSPSNKSGGFVRSGGGGNYSMNTVRPASNHFTRGVNSASMGRSGTSNHSSSFAFRSGKNSPLISAPREKFGTTSSVAATPVVTGSNTISSFETSQYAISWEGFRYFDNYTLNGPRMLSENMYAFFAVNFVNMANNTWYMMTDRQWTGKVLTIENETSDTLYVSYSFIDDTPAGRINRSPSDRPNFPFGTHIMPLESVQLKLYQNVFMTNVYRKDEKGKMILIKKFSSSSIRGNYMVKIR